jgi:hypothetical protein
VGRPRGNGLDGHRRVGGAALLPGPERRDEGERALLPARGHQGHGRHRAGTSGATCSATATRTPR